MHISYFSEKRQQFSGRSCQLLLSTWPSGGQSSSSVFPSVDTRHGKHSLLEGSWPATTGTNLPVQHEPAAPSSFLEVDLSSLRPRLRSGIPQRLTENHSWVFFVDSRFPGPARPTAFLLSAVVWNVLNTEAALGRKQPRSLTHAIKFRTRRKSQTYLLTRHSGVNIHVSATVHDFL